ncbi:peptidase family S51 [[Eubacterium] yurii subsp. margaretiae ATCC 43715]|nr:peptidase family S51 [[Eubacterium] yurii subsp. margaretiae ATCC 43715]
MYYTINIIKIRGENKMSRKLFLSSSFSDVSQLLTELLGDLSNKRVTFIPTASKVEKVNFFVKSGKKALEKMGAVIDELELSTATAEEIKTKIEKNDIIYVSGGNTFFLLQEMKKTGADKLIIEEIGKGKLYIGESAGSIITSPNIEYIKLMDPVEKAPELSDYNSLNLVDFYILPHYNNFPFKKVADKIFELYSTKLPLRTISNDEVILVDGDKVDIKHK